MSNPLLSMLNTNAPVAPVAPTAPVNSVPVGIAPPPPMGAPIANSVPVATAPAPTPPANLVAPPQAPGIPVAETPAPVYSAPVPPANLVPQSAESVAVVDAPAQPAELAANIGAAAATAVAAQPTEEPKKPSRKLPEVEGREEITITLYIDADKKEHYKSAIKHYANQQGMSVPLVVSNYVNGTFDALVNWSQTVVVPETAAPNSTLSAVQKALSSSVLGAILAKSGITATPELLAELSSGAIEEFNANKPVVGRKKKEA